ncbi:S8 family serine peptidase, partial [Myxococcota bacterium]
DPEARGHGTKMVCVATQGTTALKAVLLTTSSVNDVMEAIDDAVSRGAKVINVSLGMEGLFGWVAADMFAAAVKKHPKVLFVTAAGNESADIFGWNSTTKFSRKKPDNLLVVASGTAKGELWGQSNHNNRYVSFAAPGFSDGPDGTSIAAANVTNLAGKLLAICPKLTLPQLMDVIRLTADQTDHWAQYVRHGVINPKRAMLLAGLLELTRRGESARAACERLGLQPLERQHLIGLMTEIPSVSATGALSTPHATNVQILRSCDPGWDTTCPPQFHTEAC